MSFAQNCSIVGLVAAPMRQDRLNALAAAVRAAPGLVVTVDVREGEVRAGEFVEQFRLEDHVRTRLLEGGDPIAQTLEHEGEIAAFEARRPSWMPTTNRSERA